jgi:ribonuclease Z
MVCLHEPAKESRSNIQNGDSKMSKVRLLPTLAIVGAVGAFAYYLGHSDALSGKTLIESANAAEQEPSPTKAAGGGEVYFPNTEDLAPDEMRVIACGTGMPTTRAAQAAACFLVELGNGDKFFFDVGSGSSERISSLQIPYNYLNKVFIGHLHTDHFVPFTNSSSVAR